MSPNATTQSLRINLYVIYMISFQILISMLKVEKYNSYMLFNTTFHVLQFFNNEVDSIAKSKSSRVIFHGLCFQGSSQQSMCKPVFKKQLFLLSLIYSLGDLQFMPISLQ